MDYQQILKDIYQEIQPYASIGKQADYIPALAKINPDQFGSILSNEQSAIFRSIPINDHVPEEI